MSRVLAARAFIAKMWRGDAAGSTLWEAAWALVDIPGR
jgi:hypothetical protein